MTETIINDYTVKITHGEHFAIVSKKPKFGFYTITTSFAMNADIAIILERSGIMDVRKYSKDGTAIFKRLSFYSHELLIDLFIDLFENHSNKLKKHG